MVGVIFAGLVWSYCVTGLRRGSSWRLVFASYFLMEGEATTMNEEVRVLLARLKFSEEEAKMIVTQSKIEMALQGWEAWVVSKLLTKERIHKESMYRVLRFLQYMKDWVKFVEVGRGTFLIKLAP